ncbi:MAG: leucine-rich repeat protein [Clostridiales bacterium]|nr:leucine-rich repeat protein [Clostridiales bacterium]
MLKFCPECGSKISGGKFCGNCGVDLSKYETDSVATDNTDAPEADGAVDELQASVDEKQTRDDKLRVMIIRGAYDEAEKICNERIEVDPMDKTAYIGLIRIVSHNYKEYEGVEIAEHIRIAEEIFGGEDELLKNIEYAKYYVARKAHLDELRRRMDEERRLSELFEFSVNADGSYTINKLKDNTAISVVIPNSVTRIGKNAFLACGSLTSIEIPDSVTSIGEQAFSSCISLAKIEIPNSVTSIGEYAFFSCNSLASIVIPDGVVRIESYLFAHCSSLASVKIPSGVTFIGERAFSGCSRLTGIEIPNTVVNIDERVFSGCSGLGSIKIPDSVTIIGERAFYGCSDLESVEIGNSVKSIGESAFFGCSSLTSIDIPDSVTSMGDSMFSGCSSLKKATVSGDLRYNDFPDNCEVMIRQEEN